MEKKPQPQSNEVAEQPQTVVQLGLNDIAQLIHQAGNPVKEKKVAVKINDGDHIGKLDMPIVGTGYGLHDYVQCLCRVILSRRASTHAAKKGMESYPSSISVSETYKKQRLSHESTNESNQHIIGTAVTFPGQPNDCILWLPANLVNKGASIPMDMKWAVKDGEQTEEQIYIINP